MNIMSMTSYIPTMKHNGVKLTACGFRDRRYTCAVVEGERTYYFGIRTIASATEYFATHTEVQKMVLYIYHMNKGTFDVRKYYER